MPVSREDFVVVRLHYEIERSIVNSFEANTGQVIDIDFSGNDDSQILLSVGVNNLALHQDVKNLAAIAAVHSCPIRKTAAKCKSHQNRWPSAAK
jgi:hypothetical protein